MLKHSERVQNTCNTLSSQNNVQIRRLGFSFKHLQAYIS